MILNPIKVVLVDDYAQFKKKFKIKNDLEGGPDGSDMELIQEDLEAIPDQTWHVEFHETHQDDGFFRLVLVSGNRKTTNKKARRI